ncbi:glyoxalase [Deltaproteobacteria bacterium]|nr:glyoxalase [Deltaproteobacteria bacterium]
MPKRALVVLSGCGHLDGSEIHEAVLTLLAFDRAGATVQCAAPNKPQVDVVDHLTHATTGESRNVLTESARIARGRVVDLATVNEPDFDLVFLPGGYGAAKNLSNVASHGPNASVDPHLLRVLRAFRAANKPIGAVCIAPAVLVAALHEGSVTIGNDPGTAAAIVGMGGEHTVCPVTEMHVDQARKIVTAPAYMYDAGIAQVALGIEAAVNAALELA